MVVSRTHFLGDCKNMKLILMILAVSICGCNLRNPLKLKKPKRDAAASQVADNSQSEAKETEELKPAEFDLLMKKVCENKLPDDIKGEAAGVIKGNTSFALTLFEAIRGNEENVAFSPFSVSTALAMTYGGAQGDTAKEMKETLKFPIEDPKIHDAFSYILKDLNCNEDAAYELRIANGLWAQQDYKFSKTYFELLSEKYGAPAVNVDFVGNVDGVRTLVNDWTAKATKDKIPEILPADGITKMTRLVLTNALYFKAPWLKEFNTEATQDGEFWVKGKDKANVPLMRLKDTFTYFEQEGPDGFKAVELSYRANSKPVATRLSFVVLLPAQNDGLQALQKTLDQDKLEKVIAGLGAKSINLTLPKFKFSSSFDLAKSLSSMGMKSAFTDAADFSSMEQEGKKNLYLAKVLHQVFFDLHEKGTEAAAATAAVANYKTAAPSSIDVVIDHPFMFFVRDKSTNSILFLGQVVDPR